MGWSTELFCRVTFNRKTYNTRTEVEDDLARATAQVEDCKNTLRDLALMTEPEKLLASNEECTPYEAVKNMVEDTLLQLEEELAEMEKLQLLLDRWDDCHNKKGLAIAPPEKLTYDTAYLWGDYVKNYAKTVEDK